MANAGSHIVVDSNTVLIVPATGQSFTEAELTSLLAGLPQIKPLNSTNVKSAIPKQTVTHSNPSSVAPIKTEVASSKRLVTSIGSNQITGSDSCIQPNACVKSKFSGCNQVVTPTCSNPVLVPISPNILTPDASPKFAAHSVSNPVTTPVRVKGRYFRANISPGTPKITHQISNPLSNILIGSPNKLLATPVVSTAAAKQCIPNDVKPFGTLVFFDLETTGLGHMIGKPNVQITEISMVAIDRKEFWQSKNSELKDVRIIHKLSMCVRPRSSVSPGAAKITGLDNYNLNHQCPFDENAATTIISFLSHLPKPVCLLAHNGNAFDFPLLKAELKRLSMELPSDLFVADTLSAFKSIGIAESPPDRKVCKSVKYGKNGRLSHSLENLHLFFFNKKPTGGHSSEGDCLALAKVCHKVKDDAIPWIEANAKTLDNVQPMW